MAAKPHKALGMDLLQAAQDDREAAVRAFVQAGHKVETAARSRKWRPADLPRRRRPCKLGFGRGPTVGPSVADRVLQPDWQPLCQRNDGSPSAQWF
jgi:hypothetical protein